MEVSEEFYRAAFLLADYHHWITSNRYYLEKPPIKADEREELVKCILKAGKENHGLPS
jgi:hypothetical protein